MKLYGIGKTRWNRPYWLMQEMGIEFEEVIIDPRIGEHRTEEFLKLNPHGKLPVLVDGEVVLFESVAICHYLIEKFQDTKLMPQNTVERAQVHQWIMFGMTELESALQRIDKHVFLYPEEKRLPADIDLAREDYLKGARVLEQALDGRDFLVGNRFSVADIVLGYVVIWAGWENLLEETPNLQRYRERLMQRPGIPETLTTPPLEP